MIVSINKQNPYKALPHGIQDNIMSQNNYKLKLAGKATLLFETKGLRGYGMCDVENALRKGNISFIDIVPDGMNDKEEDMFTIKLSETEIVRATVKYL